MATIEVYKVVRCSWDDALTSVIMAHEDVCVEYHLGKRIHPKVKGTPLAAFTDERQAQRFARAQSAHGDTCVVLRCEAKPWDGETFVHVPANPTLYPEQAALFWRGEKHDVFRSHWGWWPVPYGTTWCAWVKPLEVV